MVIAGDHSQITWYGALFLIATMVLVLYLILMVFKRHGKNH